jgi:hypothetical protein
MSIQGLVICGGIKIRPGIKYPRLFEAWCNGCEAGEPHYPGDLPDVFPDDCEHYDIRPIDQETAVNVLQLGGSKTYDQMWGHTDDPWAWDDDDNEDSY